jgi:uncharacterized repeat protein (TIGR03803 family)
MFSKRFDSVITTGFLALFFILALFGSAHAQHLQSFAFNGTNGSGPDGGLVVDGSGNFYGTTGTGGAWGFGVAYEINATSESTLYDFKGSGSGDGAEAIGSLIFDSAGNLYGVTSVGGTGDCVFGETVGCGTVFELSPPSFKGGPWTETVLYSFQGLDNSDGSKPFAGLVFDDAGSLYGTTFDGGNSACDYGCGTIFELSPPSIPGGTWTETVLHSFTGGTDDGLGSLAQLVFDEAGNLYGTTYEGGLQNYGTVFQLSPPSAPGGTWTESLIYSFHKSGMAVPVAGLTWGPNGSLFGTAYGGKASGGVFSLTPSGQGEWTYKPVYEFLTPANPQAGVVFGGPSALYGTAGLGGFVYEISYSGGSVTETKLYDVGGSVATLVVYKGALYGTTFLGTQNGTVFRLSR